MNEVLAALLRHHQWSNLTVIDFCRTLSDEQLALTVPGTYGGTLDTLRHIVANEAYYLTFIAECDSVNEFHQRGRFSGWDHMRATAEATSNALISMAGRVDGDPVQRGEHNGEPYARSTSLFITQFINHATEHRSHIRTTLSSHGITPPEIDGWHWRKTLPDTG